MQKTEKTLNLPQIAYFVGAFLLYCLIITCIIACLGRKMHSEHFNVYRFQQTQMKKNQKCFELPEKSEKLQILDDVLKSRPPSDTTVFFHHTSCAENGYIRYTFRQACGIESAAKWNPKRDVFILHAAKGGSSLNNTMMNALKSYANIHFRDVDLSNYAGDDFPPNFAVVDSELMNKTVLRIDSNFTGRKLAEEFLREYTQNYQPFQPNEPDAITPVLKRICKEEELHTMKRYSMKPEKCLGLKLYPTKAFFPISESNWSDLFTTDPKIVNKTMEDVKDATAIYLWKHMLVTKNINSGSMSAYEKLAEMNCPKVFATIPLGAVF